mgnify:CR=1 FL=1
MQLSPSFPFFKFYQDEFVSGVLEGQFLSLEFMALDFGDEIVMESKSCNQDKAVSNKLSITHGDRQ